MAEPPPRAHDTWLTSDRVIPSNFVRPLLQFTHVEAAGGVVLLAAALIAVAWANSPFGDSYFAFWDTQVSIEIGSFHFEETYKGIVNDGLMVIFFFVVGLEIKRELVVGELRNYREAALPAFAALGGMIVPAAIYLLVVAGHSDPEATNGWGIPMATDIAFSVGILSLLGSRISIRLKLFLLALAIADDIGAITVIAIFYTADLSLTFLGAAIGGLILLEVAKRVGIRSMVFYVPMGFLIWFFTLESGVHATLAGVVLGLMMPVRPWYSDEEYFRRSGWILSRYKMDSAAPNARARVDEDALELAEVAKESVSPLDRLERKLHPWSSFVVVPIFALANAGVSFANAQEVVKSDVTLAVAAGLVLGKLIGISGFSWLGVKLRLGVMAATTTWRHIIGVAALAGVGFTVSLFITELAFTGEMLKNEAKVGVFTGSIVAGIIGFLILRTGKTPEQRIEAGKESLGLGDPTEPEPNEA
jgi:NhaA family Na+:H+ antiporter